jgi:hypothetical protein
MDMEIQHIFPKSSTNGRRERSRRPHVPAQNVLTTAGRMHIGGGIIRSVRRFAVRCRAAVLSC